MLPPARGNSLIGCGQLASGGSWYGCEPADDDGGSRLKGMGARLQAGAALLSWLPSRGQGAGRWMSVSVGGRQRSR
jgi:hypothetical protein